MKSFETKLLSGGLCLLISAGIGCNSHSTIAQNNAANQVAPEKDKQKAKPMLIIQQGTVGKLGDFSIGVRNLTSETANLAIWNSKMPQIKRNDYNIGFKIKSGELIPIGNKFYKIGKITENSGNKPSGTIEIETEPIDTVEIKLDENTLIMPVGGILELYGLSIEVNSVETRNGKPTAEVEIYSNDYPKADLEKKNDVQKINLSAGDQIPLGEKKHKVVAAFAAKENRRGLLALSSAPVN